MSHSHDSVTRCDLPCNSEVLQREIERKLMIPNDSSRTFSSPKFGSGDLSVAQLATYAVCNVMRNTMGASLGSPQCKLQYTPLLRSWSAGERWLDRVVTPVCHILGDRIMKCQQKEDDILTLSVQPFSAFCKLTNPFLMCTLKSLTGSASIPNSS